MLGLGSVLFLSSCKWKDSDVQTDRKVEIRRFDRELFGMNPDSVSGAIGNLYPRYGEFLEVFSFRVISIGMPSELTYPGYLRMFVTDLLNREVYNETHKKYPDLEREERILGSAFSRYNHYFGNKDIPDVVAFVSRFNISTFTIGNFVGVGLDMYLGSSSEFYKRLDLPEYMKMNMEREKIPSDILYAWGSAIFPFHDSLNNAVSHMVHQGKLMFFVQSMLPDQPEELIIGYNRNQLKWLKKNEKMMWIYLIENKLLFTDNQMDIRKLTGPAPFTYYFTNKSPGRAGIWIGWQIVNEFSRRNPTISLEQIMEETDYQKILQFSKYDP
jgi:hypothetical protein